MLPARAASEADRLPITMKNPSLISLAALVMFAASGCDKQSPDVAKKIAELERKNNEASARQRDLEQQLEDQKLATERDAIERERLQIEEDRAELERRQGEAAAAQDEAIRKREEALANREGRLEQFQSALEKKDDDLGRHQQQLSERDRELAGREALPFEPTEPGEPVADYGMFYDSLSSYGSWFETPDYGYVWQPVVVRDSNWRPYSRGRWACSDRGWTWISEEPFGWATYHYGRWALLRGRGWIWVPGCEWAPSWVSWRENDNHIGWAPLPPETLAYRGHAWDSTVEVQFGIGALWFNFVEIRNFGGPVYRHCLPVSRNVTFIRETRNITHIHVHNRQVISGGPQYKKLSDRIGRPLPFYRLEVDQHARQSRDSLAMRPQVQGDRLVIPAPNIDAAWNDSLKPGRIKGRMESVKAERDEGLNSELANRYRESRDESRRKAEQTVEELGGRDKLEQLRARRLQENRHQTETQSRQREARGAAGNPERPQPVDLGKRESGRKEIPVVSDGDEKPVPEPLIQQPQAPDQGLELPGFPNNRSKPREKDQPDSIPNDEPARQSGAGELQKDELQRGQPRDAEKEAIKRGQQEQTQQNEKQRESEQARNAEQEAVKRGQQEQAQQDDKQREAEQAREVQAEAVKRRQEEQALKVQQDKQRESEQARDAEKEAMKRGRQEQAQQQEKHREAEQARDAQNEAMKQREEQALKMQQEKQRDAEQARDAEKEAMRRGQQEQTQQERQRESEKARDAQNEAMKQQQGQAQQRALEQAQLQQEQAQQRAQEQAQRQQEQAQRQQEQAQQRAQEQAQQRAQEQAQQRAQEQAQQRAQEQAQRQQEQAQQRPQEQAEQRQQEQAQRQQEQAQRQQEQAQRQQEQAQQRAQEQAQRQQEQAQQQEQSRQRQQEESRQK